MSVNHPYFVSFCSCSGLAKLKPCRDFVDVDVDVDVDGDIDGDVDVGVGVGVDADVDVDVDGELDVDELDVGRLRKN